MTITDLITTKYFDVQLFTMDLAQYMVRQKLNTMSLAMLTGLNRKTLDDICNGENWMNLKLVTLLILCDFTDLKLEKYIL